MDTSNLRYQLPDSSRVSQEDHCQNSVNRLKGLIKQHYDKYNYGGILVSEVYLTKDTIITLIMIECMDTERMKIFHVKKSLKEVNEDDIFCLTENEYIHNIYLNC